MRIRAAAERGRPTLKKLLAAYLEELKQRRCSEATRAQALAVLPRLFRFLKRRAALDPRQVAREDLLAYALSLKRRRTRAGTPLSPWTLSTYLGAVRSFFAFVARRGVVLSNPAAQLELPAPERLPRQVLSERDTRRLMSAPFPGTPLGQRDRAVLELLYGTGIRLAECVMLDLGDVDLQRGLLLVRDGKGRKDRLLPLAGRAAAALDLYLRQSRPELLAAPRLAALFVTQHGTRRLLRQGIEILVRRHARRIGVRVSTHGLRHACATHLIRHGADVRQVQELLGHRDLATTALYTRVAIKDLREAVERAHPRERPPRRRRR